MTTPTLHVCTLCNREFLPSEPGPGRCPHCLRKVGVVAVPEDRPRHSWRPAWPGKWVWMAVVFVALLAGMTALLWRFGLPFSSAPGTDGLATQCEEKRVPCPLSAGQLPGALSAVADWAALTEAMDAVLLSRGTRPIPATPPDRLFTTGELLAQKDHSPLPIEAVALAFQAARFAGLDSAPCLPATARTSAPYWQRPYALCNPDCRPVYHLQKSAPEESIRYQCLDEQAFAAHFIAASAQLPLPAREAYRLFAVAREWHEDPELQLHLGVVKVRNDAREFGIEDMRSSLGSGAPAAGNLLLGEALLESGLPADALDAFLALLKVAPESPEGRLGQARSLGLLGRIDEATPLLEALLQEDPSLPGLHAALALSHRHQGQRPQAISAMRQEVATNPTREYVALLVDLLMEAKDDGAAMTLLDSLYETHQRADLALLAIEVSSAAGKDDEANRRLLAALQAHPDNVELLHLAALKHMDEKAFEEAEDVLMRLTARDPENPQVFSDLALARFGLERAGKTGAKGARKTVEEISRKWPRQVFRIAHVLSNWQYWDETERVLEDRLASDPRNRRLTGWLYFFYLAHGRPEKAEALRSQERDWLNDEAQERYEEMFEKLAQRAKARQNESHHK